ncbi:MAG: hypothetical protein GEV13_32490 [Rhodospirillales bacterium]|nr:hypothetical protein [Rhodospirillales bacterium]
MASCVGSPPAAPPRSPRATKSAPRFHRSARRDVSGRGAGAGDGAGHIDGETVKLATITYKPECPGPFPTLIFHHGSTGRGTEPVLFGRPYDPRIQAQWFTARGWAVVAPSRRGRGGSEGLYDEGFAPDRSRGYTCEAALSLAGADRALRDLDAITPPMLAQSFVDRSRIAVGGQSRGGILSVAWSGRQPAVPRAVVNLSAVGRAHAARPQPASTRRCSSAAPRMGGCRSGSMATRIRFMRWSTAAPTSPPSSKPAAKALFTLIRHRKA